MEVKNVDPKLQTYLSARNLSIAEKMGFDTVMAPCNGCYHNLKKAEYDLANDAGFARDHRPICRRKAGHETYAAGKVEDHPRTRLDQGSYRRGRSQEHA